MERVTTVDGRFAKLRSATFGRVHWPYDDTWGEYRPHKLDDFRVVLRISSARVLEGRAVSNWDRIVSGLQLTKPNYEALYFQMGVCSLAYVPSGDWQGELQDFLARGA